MKVVVSSMGDSLDAQVSPVFGRCPYFVFVDTDTLGAQAVPNPAVSATGGAGIQAAQFVAAEGAQAVLTGNVGPNAMSTLSAANVVVHPVASGTVRQAVEAFKAGQTQPTSAATAPADTGKAGMPGAGQGLGMGRGGGRGQGGGGGRAGGRGGGGRP